MKDCDNCRHYSNNGKGDENCDVRGWDFVKEDCPDFDNRFFRNHAITIEPYTELKPIESEQVKVKMSFFDIVETHPNCTVQILRNSVTGDVSVGKKQCVMWNRARIVGSIG